MSVKAASRVCFVGSGIGYEQTLRSPPDPSPNATKDQIAARALVTYLIPGCVGRGVRLESEGSSVGGGGGGGGVWKFGVQKIKQTKNLKIQIRSAQNVGKVWISRKKILLALFGAI